MVAKKIKEIITSINDLKPITQTYGKKPIDWKWLLKDWKVWLIIIFIMLILIGAISSCDAETVNREKSNVDVVDNIHTQNINTQTTQNNATETNFGFLVNNISSIMTTLIIIPVVLMFFNVFYKILKSK